MKSFCEACGINIYPNEIGHFCNATRYCPKCGDILPKLSSGTYSHRCPEEKIEITRDQLDAALTKACELYVFAERPTETEDGKILKYFIAKELGFK